MMKTIREIIDRAKGILGDSGTAPRLALVCAQDDAVMEAAAAIRESGLKEIILVGDQAEMERIAQRKNIDIKQFHVIDEKDKAKAAFEAVTLVRDGKADMLMKGLVESAVFLKAVLRKDMGINMGRLISHVCILESPQYHKLLLLTDGAINIAPDLNDKALIIENAVALAHSIGIEMPKVALLAALEMVNPGKMPCTTDAAILSQMNRRGDFPGCIIDGPLALDNAVNENSVRVKKINSPVAGDADILVVPAIEAGNILYKALVIMGKAKCAGLVTGTRIPVILTSRADSAETKAASIALGILSWYHGGKG